MIGYLDTSAFVPLLVAEPGSLACQRFWGDADAVVSCRLMHVEAAAALAQAHRMDRLDAGQHRQARTLLDELWAEIELVEIDHELVRAAATMADQLALRGYDAVHAAAADQIADADLVAAGGDKRLLAAWNAIGIATYDVNAPV